MDDIIPLELEHEKQIQSQSVLLSVESDGRIRLPQRANGMGLSRRALARSCLFIVEKIGEKISVQDIADAACISRYHFCRLFRQSTGESPMEFLLRVRIERAKALLAREELPISEIAASLGFCDQSHFSRNFRRIVGVTPLQFSRGASDGDLRAETQIAHARTRNQNDAVSAGAQS